MSKYNVYVVGSDGNGMVQKLEDWDGEDALEVHLNVFAADSVIIVEPDYSKRNDETHGDAILRDQFEGSSPRADKRGDGTMTGI
jgi:hypothetical protein